MSLLFGCMGPTALHQALPEYDETIHQLQAQSLLLNIARARYHIPPHFTDTTSIAATFTFQAEAGVTGNFPSNITGVADATIDVGATVAENPTIELVPLRGEAFSKQMLTPLDDNQFRLLVTEGGSLDMLIRLMAKSFRFHDATGGLIRSVRNRPDIPDEYAEFRRIAAHLSSLDATDHLFARQLSFIQSETITLAEPPSAGDVLAARQSGFVYTALDEKGKYELSQQIIGNTVVSNYDPLTQPNAERASLNKLITLTPSNFVDIEIRPGYPGGDYPLHGAFQLRSFNEILTFVARGIADAPEFEVDPDPRTNDITGSSPTGDWRDNPSRVLTIVESPQRPAANISHVHYRGQYYYVQQNPWDFAAFNSLYLLLQMSAHATPQRAFPITISK